MNNYSILINTCDKFEDCWDPFFKLWSIYWKECKAKIYLNTEYKDYDYQELNIIPIKGCSDRLLNGKIPTWSQCLRWALEKIETDIVLYMQEDYFINAPVDNKKVEHYAQYMSNHVQVPCIQLTTEGILNGKVVDEIEHLNDSNPNHYSYVSCQASLWRKEVLLDLIRDYETAWNFEWYGSKRAKFLGYKFLTIDHEWLRNGNIVIPYLATGVIGGKWNKKVVDLFALHGIIMDYSKRGFVSEDRNRTLIQRAKFKYHFVKLKSEFEVFFLKFLLKRNNVTE